MTERPPRSTLVARTLPPVAAEEPLRVPEPELRLSCWTAEPEDRVLPPEVDRVALLLPEDRVAELPEDLVALLPVLRLRLSCWAEPVERELPEEEPEDLVALLPLLRLRLSCWTAPEDRDAPEEEPEERVAELPEELREEDEVLWEERVAPLLPRERLWASISGAVSMAMAITREAANVINLFIASEF